MDNFKSWKINNNRQELKDIIEKPWSHWDLPETVSESDLRRERKLPRNDLGFGNGSVEKRNKLPSAGMFLFGSYPESDILSISTCSGCKRKYKTQWLHSGHWVKTDSGDFICPLTKNLVISRHSKYTLKPSSKHHHRLSPLHSIQSSSNGIQTSSNYGIQACDQNTQPQNSIIKEEVCNSNNGSSTISHDQNPQSAEVKQVHVCSLPPKKKKKKAKNEPRKVVPLKDRIFDPDQHCGVPNAENGNRCTRSLTCKTHSMALRRAVPGRCINFDQLLLDHKKIRDAERAAKSALDQCNGVVPSPAATGRATLPIRVPQTSSTMTIAPVPLLNTTVVPVMGRSTLPLTTKVPMQNKISEERDETEMKIPIPICNTLPIVQAGEMQKNTCEERDKTEMKICIRNILPVKMPKKTPEKMDNGSVLLSSVLNTSDIHLVCINNRALKVALKQMKRERTFKLPNKYERTANRIHNQITAETILMDLCTSMTKKSLKKLKLETSSTSLTNGKNINPSSIHGRVQTVKKISINNYVKFHGVLPNVPKQKRCRERHPLDEINAQDLRDAASLIRSSAQTLCRYPKVETKEFDSLLPN